MSYQKGFERCSPIEPQKKLAIESWLFNRNPYIGSKKSPYNWVACHRQKKTNQGLFSLLNWGWSIAYVVFMILEVTWRLRQRTRWSLSLSWVRWFWGNKMLNWFPVKGPGRFSCFFLEKRCHAMVEKKIPCCYTLLKFNTATLPLKSYRNPKRKPDRLPVPSIFQIPCSFFRGVEVP